MALALKEKEIAVGIGTGFATIESAPKLNYSQLSKESITNLENAKTQLSFYVSHLKNSTPSALEVLRRQNGDAFEIHIMTIASKRHDAISALAKSLDFTQRLLDNIKAESKTVRIVTGVSGPREVEVPKSKLIIILEKCLTEQQNLLRKLHDRRDNVQKEYTYAFQTGNYNALMNALRQERGISNLLDMTRADVTFHIDAITAMDETVAILRTESTIHIREEKALVRVEKSKKAAKPKARKAAIITSIRRKR